MTSLTARPLADIGALSHLVEAATALSQLAGQVSVPYSNQGASLISDDDDRQQPSSLSDAAAAAVAANLRAAKKREIFPQRLMDILSDSSLSDIVTWLPHGRSFMIIRPDLFCEQVLPKYLPPVDSRGSTKYPSFTRKLNRWGFRQSNRGADTGAFHHPFFRRDQPGLCMQMVCQKSRDRQSHQSAVGDANSNTNKRSLPPKKRIVLSEYLTANPSSLPASPSRVSLMDEQSAAISSDDRSVGNSSTTSQAMSSTAPASALPPVATVVNTTKQRVPVVATPAPPLVVVPSVTTTSASSEASSGSDRALPFISNDANFVASTLRQRDTTEFLRAAKSQLFEAYQRALNEQ